MCKQRTGKFIKDPHKKTKGTSRYIIATLREGGGGGTAAESGIFQLHEEQDNKLRKMYKRN
jgi:hypothetical protein